MITLKNAYRHIAGETEEQRIRRGHFEQHRLHSYRKARTRARGASRAAYNKALMDLIEARHGDLELVSRLARRVAREADKLRAQQALLEMERELVLDGLATRV